jgi:tetratricopeptide (TPR) repeat protein
MLALGFSLAGTLQARASEPVQRTLLAVRSSQGCDGIPHSPGPRELLREGERAVDARARFWALDRPGDFLRGRALRRYRIGSGLLRVESSLDLGALVERLRFTLERSVESSHLAVYLPGVNLPCERTVHFRSAPLGPVAADLDELVAFDSALHQATEQIYDDGFAEARRLLERARSLRPHDPAPYWMLARLIILELEARPAWSGRARRVAAYEDAEAWADEAVALDPGGAEGRLWQGIARGRIITASGNLRVAVHAATGGRGPGWLEQTLRHASEPPGGYAFFGYTTRGDALYALAQYYRLAPTGWYMRVFGTRGDIERATELARRAVEIQPTRIEYRKELAIALLCRGAPGDHEEARAELERLLAIPAITRIDRLDHEHARALLSGVSGKVCWYSRDGFLEPAA